MARTPGTQEAQIQRLVAARGERDREIATSFDALIDIVQESVDEGSITISAAAGVVGISRAPLSRALNARSGPKRTGGGRGHRNDADARQRLLQAGVAHEQTKQAASDAFLDAIADEVAAGAALLAIAEGLGTHRTTLRRQLDELTARRANEQAGAGE